MYTPENNATKKLMDEVTESLSIPLFRSFPDNYEKSLRSGSSNERAQLFRTLDDVNAVIVFENFVSKENLPDKLTYTVRLKEKPMLKQGVISSKIWQSIYGPLGELDDSLVKLQWAINSNFVKIKSRSPFIRQNITILPHMRKHKISYKECHGVKYIVLHALMFFAPLFSFVFIITRLIEERCSGIEALIEVAGVPWFIIDIINFLDSLLPCFVFSVVAARYLNLESDRRILFMCLFFHCVTMILLAFACSNIIICGPNVVPTALFIYLGFFLLDLAIWPANISRMSTRIKGLLPHMPSIWIMYQILAREFRGSGGVQYNNWMKVAYFNKDHRKTVSVKLAIVMLLMQIALFFMIYLFLRLFEVKRCLKALAANLQFWRHCCLKDYAHSVRSNISAERCFENPPCKLEIEVEVACVKKSYSSGLKTVLALNDISLKIYKGEITVIVGHNGSGKTTLLSIIAGMEQQSSGQVVMRRCKSSVFRIKKKIAFCPQKSILFPELTVYEHLMFFSMIAGDPKECADETAERVMTQLDLCAVHESLPSEISIGLKRRLQIGCSLCSHSSLLLLDDPTSEIDIAARKDLYHIFSTLRGERTIILTTNFLEEADILGDRVAALQRGILCCYASPTFLKKTIVMDPGETAAIKIKNINPLLDNCSRLKITPCQQTDIELLTKTIHEVAPDATFSENVMGSLIYKVPLCSNMAALLKVLECNKVELNIGSLGLGPVSLEEVFIRLCAGCKTDVSKQRRLILKHPCEIGRIEGLPLIVVQAKELFKRQLEYTCSRLLAFILLHFILPVLLTMFLFIYFNKIVPWYWHFGFNEDYDIYSEVNKSPATYNLRGYDLKEKQHIVNKIKELFPQLQLEEGKAEHETFRDGGENSRNIFDIFVDAHNAKLQYNRNVKHSAIVGLDVLSNIIAAQELQQQTEKAITMRVGFGWDPHSPHRFVISDEFNIGIYATVITFIICITVIDDVGLPCRERTLNTRYYHIMAGCPAWLYWLVTFIYQILGYALILVPSILITIAIFDFDNYLKHTPSMRAYVICLLFCGISFYTFAYFLSQLFDEETTKIILLECLILGSFAFLFLWASKWNGLEKLGFYKFFSNTRILNPVLVYAITMRKLVTLASYNRFSMNDHIFGLYQHRKRLGDSKEYEYFSDNTISFDLRWEIILMVIYIIFFMILVLLIEYQIFRELWKRYQQEWEVKRPCRTYRNNNVATEKEYVTDTFERPRKCIKELVLVGRVWKIIFKCFGKQTFILKDLNFSVRKGECLCFVGQNGAGKSSIFKVMTRQLFITKGVMFANGYLSHENTDLYLKGLGYCPHSLCLDTFRNGSNNIRMLMRLRGIYEDVETQCHAWESILGLECFQNILVEEYSYGMERRLSLGAAMCRGERVLLLDQPLSGVDVVSRRQLWAVIQEAVTNGCCVILSSHNMEVVDHTCNQVTILDEGEMADLGTPRVYKETYAPGHSVVIKLAAECVCTPGGAARVQPLKDFMCHEFNCFLREEYLFLLHFIMPNKMFLTDLYKKMCCMAEEFKDIVEDYSAYDANFEDVFIQFICNNRCED